MKSGKISTLCPGTAEPCDFLTLYLNKQTLFRMEIHQINLQTKNDMTRLIASQNLNFILIRIKKINIVEYVGNCVTLA